MIPSIGLLHLSTYQTMQVGVNGLQMRSKRVINSKKQKQKQKQPIVTIKEKIEEETPNISNNDASL